MNKPLRLWFDGRGEIESEFRGLGSEPQFGSDTYLFIPLDQNAFVVRLFCCEHMEHDTSQFVGSRRQCFRRAEPPFHLPVVLPEIVFCMVKTLCTKSQCDRDAI